MLFEGDGHGLVDGPGEQEPTERMQPMQPSGVQTRTSVLPEVGVQGQGPGHDSEQWRQQRLELVEQLRLLQRLVAQQTARYQGLSGMADDGGATRSRGDDSQERTRAALPADGFQSLREILRYLHRQEEQSRIVSLRRVQRLGLEAPEILRRYFQSWGPVDDVLTHPAHIGPTGVCVRLGDLAFVMMASAEDARRFFAAHASSTVQIAGSPVSIAPFRREIGS